MSCTRRTGRWRRPAGSSCSRATSRRRARAPRSPASGGPIGLLRDGDMITIDAVAGTLDVALSEAELAERRRAWSPRSNDHQSGCLWRYAQTVGDAEKGAVTHPGARTEIRAYADI